MHDRLPKPDAEQITNTRETTEFCLHLGPLSKGVHNQRQSSSSSPSKLKGAGHAFNTSSFLFCSTWLPSNKHNRLLPRAKEQAASILHLAYSWVTGRAHLFDNWWISVWWNKWYCPWCLATKEHSLIFKEKKQFLVSAYHSKNPLYKIIIYSNV